MEVGYLYVGVSMSQSDKMTEIKDKEMEVTPWLQAYIQIHIQMHQQHEWGIFNITNSARIIMGRVFQKS